MKNYHVVIHGHGLLELPYEVNAFGRMNALSYVINKRFPHTDLQKVTGATVNGKYFGKFETLRLSEKAPF